MRIAIRHATLYRFAEPAWHGLQRLRLSPHGSAVQRVEEWTLDAQGAVVEARYDDHNGNATTLVSLSAGAREVVVSCGGIVETRDTAGISGPHDGAMPLWAFREPTPLTRPGPRLAELVAPFAQAGAWSGGGTLPMLHALSAAILARVAYTPGATDATTSAEAALATRAGVCQDHAHIFIGAARMLGLAARYVSGYLLMAGLNEQEAGHGWAEAYVPSLGWVGFDISNGISPDARYVRLATGMDYRDAAPVTGLLLGASPGSPKVSPPEVSLTVTQQ